MFVGGDFKGIIWTDLLTPIVLICSGVETTEADEEVNEDELLSEEAKELLTIGRDEDLDHLLTLAAEKKREAEAKATAKTTVTPARGRSKGSLFDEDEGGEGEDAFGSISSRTERMGAGDILSYLAQNSSLPPDEEEDDFLK